MPRAAQSSSCVHKRVHTEIDDMPKHNEPQYKTKANAKGVIYAYTRVDGRQVALGRAGEAAWDKYLSVLDEWRGASAFGG